MTNFDTDKKYIPKLPCILHSHLKVQASYNAKFEKIFSYYTSSNKCLILVKFTSIQKVKQDENILGCT